MVWGAYWLAGKGADRGYSRFFAISCTIRLLKLPVGAQLA